MLNLLKVNIKKAAGVLLQSKHTTAFTGAGISVESGIPPFRGKDGLWSKYDPKILELNYFFEHPKDSWEVIKEIFYDYFGKAKPNDAHKVLAEMEKNNLLQAIITQNIDNLHQAAGSKTVYEFHGTSAKMICTNCKRKFESEKIKFDKIPPVCITCGGLLKPDFIFFGEGIPAVAFQKSVEEAENADVFLLIGTTGLIEPAASIPYKAKYNDAVIIEINPERSAFTERITDIFLQGKAGEVMTELGKHLFEKND